MHDLSKKYLTLILLGILTVLTVGILTPIIINHYSSTWNEEYEQIKTNIAKSVQDKITLKESHLAEVSDDIKEQIISKNIKYNKGEPVSSFSINTDSTQNQLEPIYYWVLDFINNMGFKTKKVVDNFTSSPGSAHFSEMGQRASLMQQQGTKLMVDVNQVVKSALNIIYDLRDFKTRLKHYEDLDSKDANIKDSALLALKQIWLDQVDMPKRQGVSIHQMTAQLGYTTLRDAFMVAKDIDDVIKMSREDEGTINQQVKRILMPRMKEFYDWVEMSEKELNKRFSIEKNYLKTQVETIKIYSAWLKPYLKAAEDLKQKGFEGDAALVNAFSTSMFELTLFAQNDVKPPSQISGYNFKRKYNQCLVINLKFRAHLLQKVDQRGNYAPAFGGRIEMNFDSYALSDEEIKLIEKKIEKEDVNDVLNLNLAEDALKELQADLNEFLDDDKKKEKTKEKEKKKRDEEDINPFGALFGMFKPRIIKKDKDKEISEAKDITSDNWYEKQVRDAAKKSARGSLYAVYDIYKKSHGLASSPENFEN